MELHKDFKEFINLLNAHSVDYVIVGGYAMAFHGHPRFTGDIDFFVKPDRDNAKKIVSVLKDFGFSSLDISEDDFVLPGRVIQLGFPPVRIDIVTSLPVMCCNLRNSKRLFIFPQERFYYVKSSHCYR